jgi:hypothetical protein
LNLFALSAFYLRYRPIGQEGYVLYSVGWNRQDDEGEVEITSRRETVSLVTGDWVWRIERGPWPD